MRFIKLLSIAIFFMAMSFGAKAQTISVNSTIYNSGVFSITVSAPATVYYSVLDATATQQIATSFASAATSVSFDATALTKSFATPTVAGSYIVYAQTDASNTSLAISNTFAVVVDRTIPLVTISNVVAISTSVVNYTIVANEKVSVYSIFTPNADTFTANQVVADENNLDGTTEANRSTDVSIINGTPNTTYNYFIVAKDFAGNLTTLSTGTVKTLDVVVITPVTPSFVVTLNVSKIRNVAAVLSITSDRTIAKAYYKVDGTATVATVSAANLTFNVVSGTSATTTVSSLTAGTHTFYAVVVDVDGNVSTVAVSAAIVYSSVENPAIDAQLVSVYPNPVSEKATIAYALKASSNVTINVFDIAGKLVKSVENSVKGAGSYEVSFDSSDLKAGVYVYQLITNQGTVNKQFVVKR